MILQNLLVQYFLICLHFHFPHWIVVTWYYCVLSFSFYIPADAMCLGNVVMTISLILLDPRGEQSKYTKRGIRPVRGCDTSTHIQNTSILGGIRILCHMALVGQWKVSMLMWVILKRCKISGVTIIQYSLCLKIESYNVLYFETKGSRFLAFSIQLKA